MIDVRVHFLHSMEKMSTFPRKKFYSELLKIKMARFTRYKLSQLDFKSQFFELENSYSSTINTLKWGELTEQ